MNQAKLETHNVYALHHELLRRAIFAAATIDADALESVAIELSEGYLPMQYTYAEDCGTFLDNFEYLRHLEETKELDKQDCDYEIPSLERHDVFFALALDESNVAARQFSNQAPSSDWSIEDRMREGVKAAISAAKAFQYACWLKERRRDSRARGMPAPTRYLRDLC
jgi:hypothetical protein